MSAPDTIPRLNTALDGRYRIERQLGEGGMATVYLADDLRHERKVALKVLKPELAAVVGAERFLAEIKTTANLQHPHILPLFDSGEADNFLFYVMPFVEGESLRERLEREHQLPVDEAVAIARKVAGALQAAHERGVIHRDIKPANILLSKGEPLVSDFGIALAVGMAGGGRLTETGMSLGTPHYMSPEQATGDLSVGAGSDIYALGCVLYEMLVGDPPYVGSTAQAILGKIVTSDADPVTKHRRSVPANVDATIRKALEKMAADRFGSANSFREALSDPGFTYGDRGGGAVGTTGGRWRFPANIVAIVAAALVGAVVGMGIELSRARSEQSRGPVVRSFLELPAGAYLNYPIPALSPDGSMVVVTGMVNGRRILLLHHQDELDFTVIEGTDLGTVPAFSADGLSLVFATPSGLKGKSLSGGPVAALTDEPPWGQATMADDETIYYTPDLYSGIWAIPGDGGDPYEITRPDSTETGHWHPQLLPDGEHLLFTVIRTPVDSSQISVVSLVDGSVSLLQERAFYGRYSPTGHLLFGRGHALYAIALRPDGLATRGREELLIDDLATSPLDALADFAISQDGTLVYIPETELNTDYQLVWVDRATGAGTPLQLPPAQYTEPSLSPDDQLLAATFRVRSADAKDLMTLSLEQPRATPLAEGPRAQFHAIWTPDRQAIVYACEYGTFAICSKVPNSTEPESVRLRGGKDKVPYSVSSDASRVFLLDGWPLGIPVSLDLGDPTAGPDTLAVRGGGELASIDVSPDGRWIAYVNASDELWVESLDPTVSLTYLVSSEASADPLWTKHGRELVYRGRYDRGVYSVDIDVATGEPGPPNFLFEDPYYMSANRRYRQWDVTADGERFLMVRQPEDQLPRRLVLVQNFFEELRERVPVD